MARTKQTVRAKSIGGKPARFQRGGGPAPGTSGNNGAPAPGDQGGKAPQGQAPIGRSIGCHTGTMPPALCIAHENSACRMTGAYAIPQG